MPEQVHDPLLVDYYNSKDPILLNELAAKYMYLVRHVTSKLVPSSAGVIEKEESFSAAQYGLCQALQNFIPIDTPSSFANYAIQRIRGAVLDAVRSNGKNRYKKTPTWKSMDQIVEKLTQQLKRNPTIVEVAAAMEREPQAVAHRMDLENIEFLSLEGLSTSEDGSIEETLSSNDDLSLEVESAILQQTLRQIAAKNLTAVEFFVIQEIYFSDRTISQVREDLQVSITRVSQWHRRALTKLREKIGATNFLDAISVISCNTSTAA